MMEKGKTQLSRRSFLQLSGVLAGAAALAACAPAVSTGGQSGAEEPAAQTTALEMYTRLTNNEQLEKLSARYQDAHAGSQLTVSAFDGRDMLTKLTTAVAGGLPPDLVMIDIAFTAQFADRNVLMDIGPIVDEANMREDAFKGYDVGTTWKGKYISYPMWSDCSALYYNKKLMADAGVTSLEGPKSWAEVVEQATAVSGLGEDIWGFLTNVTSSGATWFLWAPFMWAAGGQTFNADLTGTEFDSTPALSAAKLWVDMYLAGLAPIECVSGTWGDVEGLFTSGKSGMLLSGPYMVGLMAGQYPELDYGITLIPGPEAGTASSFVGGDGMSVIEATKQKDAAIEAFRWITDAALMKEVAMENNGTWIQGLPPRNSAVDAEYLEKFPNYAVFIDALKVGTLVNHPAIFEIDKPLKLAFEKMMLEQVAVEDAMAELDAAGDEILQRYNSTQ
ncbi:MAG: extracellular solute-binding protein [Chloroflexi bacterium]|nr:extracellular solute-binding protein [Chloroflexota bacterium]